MNPLLSRILKIERSFAATTKTDVTLVSTLDGTFVYACRANAEPERFQSIAEAKARYPDPRSEIRCENAKDVLSLVYLERHIYEI